MLGLGVDVVVGLGPEVGLGPVGVGGLLGLGVEVVVGLGPEVG